MSKPSDERTTPQELFDKLHGIFHFDLEAAATAANAKCERFYTKEDDALKQEWPGPSSIFVNPPYSRGQLIQWVRKAASAQALVVMVLPGDIGTKWFHEAVQAADIIHLVKGRFAFNVIAVWGCSPYPPIDDLNAAIPGFSIKRQRIKTPRMLFGEVGPWTGRE